MEGNGFAPVEVSNLRLSISTWSHFPPRSALVSRPRRSHPSKVSPAWLPLSRLRSKKVSHENGPRPLEFFL
jgi:hypothetical protein